MLKISLLLGVFDTILCEIHTRLETIASQTPSCKYPPLCYLSETYKSESKNMFLPYPNSQNYGRQQSNLQRSYYSGFDSSTLPAYYSQVFFKYTYNYINFCYNHVSITIILHVYFRAFDPISVLASLAFLAFLLQSFASLFDRSRSILPTIISGRQSTTDLSIPEISKHVSHALQEYVSISN